MFPQRDARHVSHANMVPNLALPQGPSQNGSVSVAAAMPTSSRETMSVSGAHGPQSAQHERVLRVRVTGFSRRFAAALIDDRAQERAT